MKDLGYLFTVLPEFGAAVDVSREPYSREFFYRRAQFGDSIVEE
ncbi:hypothetical protein ACIBVL_04405 [Streptomyces sp. NPDC049687]